MSEIPTTLAAFRLWRLRTEFATPELANHARLVEADLALLSKCGHLKRIVALVQQNVASFGLAFMER